MSIEKKKMDEAKRVFGEWRREGSVEIPWLSDPEFIEAYSAAKQRTLVSQDRCHMLWALGKQALDLDGDFAECGVFRGGTASLLARIIKDSGRRLLLFDTFSGIPPGDPAKDNRYLAGGEFGDTSLDTVRAFLAKDGLRAEFVPGLIPDTLVSARGMAFSFVHVDVDIYRPAKHCLEWFYPRMVPGGVILLDDYGFAECAGVWKAVQEFTHPHIPLATGQALIIKH